MFLLVCFENSENALVVLEPETKIVKTIFVPSRKCTMIQNHRCLYILLTSLTRSLLLETEQRHQLILDPETRLWCEVEICAIIQIIALIGCAMI
jgi:hypothetical protein